MSFLAKVRVITFVSTLAVGALVSAALYADTTTFNFSGTLANGQAVTGSFTLDEALGTMTAWDITSQFGCPIAGCPHEYSSAIPGDLGVVVPNLLGQLQLLFQTVGPLESLELDFAGSATSFSGGSVLIPWNFGCCAPGFGSGEVNTISAFLPAPFLSGSASPITTTPEPSSLSFFIIGALGLVNAGRKKWSSRISISS